MSVGPIEYLVVAFPGNKFRGEIVPALAELVESNTIRILDLVFILKDEEGNVAAIELADLDPEDEAAAMSDISRGRQRPAQRGRHRPRRRVARAELVRGPARLRERLGDPLRRGRAATPTAS